MLAVLLVAASILPIPISTSAREWNQPGGNAEGSAWFDSEPLHEPPITRWSVPFRSIEAEPVISAGVAFLAADAGAGRRLFALALEDGRMLANAPISGAGPARLAACNATLLVVLPGRVESFVLRGNQLRSKYTVPGEWTGTPVVHSGVLLVERAKREVVALDVENGRLIGALPGFGRPAIAFEDARSARVAFAAPTNRPELALATARLTGIGGTTLAFESGPPGEAFPLAAAGSIERASAAFVDRPLGGGFFVWHLSSESALKSKQEPAASGFFSGSVPTRFSRAPAAVDGSLYGFDGRGVLMSKSSGTDPARELVRVEARPPGASVQSASAARRVLYLGNWAVDLETRRVLWCLPDLAPAGPLQPAGDAALLLSTRGAELVLLGPAPSDASGPAAEAPMPPGSGDALILASGERIAGEIAELAGGRIRVSGVGGAQRELGADEVALVERGSEARLVGGEGAVERAFWRALSFEHRTALLAHFERCRKAGLVVEARSALDSLSRFGLERGAREALIRKLSLTPAAKAATAKETAACSREAAELRERATLRFEAAATWCATRGFELAASALLAVCEELSPGRASVRKAAALLFPAGYPGREEPGALSRWLALSSALLPSDARVLAPDDPSRKRAAGEAWKENVLAVRTRDVLLFSREHDPTIVGECLRRAQLGIRALEEEFAPAARGEALVVFLHEDRASYLAEEPPGGSPAPVWSAGYYTPVEGVSRFYVPRGESEEPLRRGLAEVFCHELTHHWTSQRWLGSDAHPAQGEPTTPGFWIVEGFARYVEDQLVDFASGKRERFGDEHAGSLEAAAQLHASGKLIPLYKLVDLSQSQFQGLGDGLRGVVRPRSSLVDLKLSERMIFYEEAGALVFFLAHACQERGRTALSAYLSSWYAGSTRVEGWKALGWETHTALQAEFDAFLSKLAVK